MLLDLKMEERATAKESRQRCDAENSKETDFSLEPPEGMQSC